MVSLSETSISHAALLQGFGQRGGGRRPCTAVADQLRRLEAGEQGEILVRQRCLQGRVRLLFKRAAVCRVDFQRQEDGILFGQSGSGGKAGEQQREQKKGDQEGNRAVHGVLCIWC